MSRIHSLLEQGFTSLVFIALLAAVSIVNAEEAESGLPAAQVEGFTADYIELNSLRLHYLEGEQKHAGAPLVFLHGFPFNSETWLPIMSRLNEARSVAALDGRGYPRSEKPEAIEQYRINLLVDDVADFLGAKYPDQKVVLIGHDWGATLAWTVAQAKPELIEKVVAMNAPPYNVFLDMLATSETQQKAASYIPRLKTQAFEDALVANGAASVWGFGFAPLLESGAIDAAFKARFFDAWNEEGAIRGGINWYRANIPDSQDIVEADHWPSKDARVTVPSLLLWSDGEVAFVKDTFEAIKDVVDDLEVVIVDDAGHLVQLQYSQTVSQHIAEFIEP